MCACELGEQAFMGGEKRMGRKGVKAPHAMITRWAFHTRPMELVIRTTTFDVWPAGRFNTGYEGRGRKNKDEQNKRKKYRKKNKNKKKEENKKKKEKKRSHKHDRRQDRVYASAEYAHRSTRCRYHLLPFHHRRITLLIRCLSTLRRPYSSPCSAGPL